MELNTLAGMFTSPEEIRQKRMQELVKQQASLADHGGTRAGLLAQIAGQGNVMGGAMAQLAGKAMGMGTPDEVRAQRIKELVQGIENPDDPMQLKMLAVEMNKLGYTKEAMAVNEKARNMAKENAIEQRAIESHTLSMKVGQQNLKNAQTQAEFDAIMNPLRITAQERALARSAWEFNRLVAQQNRDDAFIARMGEVTLDPENPLKYYADVGKIAQETGNTELLFKANTQLLQEVDKLQKLKQDKETKLKVSGALADDPYTQLAYLLGEIEFAPAHTSVINGRKDKLTQKQKEQEQEALVRMVQALPELQGMPELQDAITEAGVPVATVLNLSAKRVEAEAARAKQAQDNSARTAFADKMLTNPAVKQAYLDGLFTSPTAALNAQKEETQREFRSFTNFIDLDTGETFYGGVKEDGTVVNMNNGLVVPRKQQGAATETTKPTDKFTDNDLMATFLTMPTSSSEEVQKLYDDFIDKATKGIAWLGTDTPNDEEALAAQLQLVLTRANELRKQDPVKYRSPQSAIYQAMREYAPTQAGVQAQPSAPNGASMPTPANNSSLSTVLPPKKG